LQPNHLSLHLGLILFLCLGQNLAHAQLKDPDVWVSQRVFGFKEGYEVHQAQSMLYDNSGWLWISGQSLKIVGTEINVREPIIQCYSGTAFYTVALPKLKKATITRVEMVKRADGQFFVLFKSEETTEVFLLNPNTLVFSKVEFSEGEDILSVALFPYKDSYLLFVETPVQTKLYRLEADLNSIFLADLGTAVDPNFEHLIPFDDMFLLDDRSGVHLYSSDGQLIRHITLSELGIDERDLDYNLSINTWFKQGGNTYVHFDEIPEYYAFDTISKKWRNLQNLKGVNENHQDDFFKEEKVYIDPTGNVLLQVIEETGSAIETDLIRIDLGIYRLAETISRDLTKELLIGDNGKLHHYHFEKRPVKTFLEDRSIRSMLQLNEEEVLVGTDFSGWYQINLKTQETKKIELSLNGQSYLISQNRGIFKTSGGFWSNYDKGVIYVDEKSKAITSFLYYPVATMVENEQYIYYGTLFHGLMRFDKELKENKILVRTPKADMQAITKVGKNLYIAATEGLLVFANDTLLSFMPGENPKDNFLMSVAYHEKLGLLLGSQSGKLYRFDPDTKAFSVLFEDPLAASIATMLFDDRGRIWLNTFKGIIAFDPDLQTTVRFSETDGLSFYEANRYSALKTHDGHFLVGTLKGLNYFHPDKIEKKHIEAQLRWVSITHSNQDNSITNIRSTNDLAKVEKLLIPPNNKTVQLSFGLFGILDLDKVSFRYRLNDQNWINLQNKTDINLFNLPSGDYTLQIEALNPLGETIGRPMEIFISAQQFFYQTAWFYLIVSLLVLGIGTLIYFEKRKKHLLKAQYASEIVQSEEAERVRISKELHDNIGQKILLLKMRAQSNNALDSETVKLFEDTLNDVRNMSHNLHPFQFEQLGLIKSIENLIDSFQKNSPVFYSYEIDPVAEKISGPKKLFLFRMLQEGITNVEKHAQATACNLKVFKKNDRIVFQLKDNGKGFVYQKDATTGNLGMKNLQERALYIGAVAEIKSITNKGTTLTISLPLP